MKTENKRHLKGSVLFTVVSVLSLLIIFLMGTLVLASSASKRSHKNYSTSQAEYTARAAIESFANAMSSNAAIAQTVVNMSTKGDTVCPTVEINQKGMGSVGYYDNGGNWIADKIQVEYVDDTYAYAVDKDTGIGSWEKQQVIRILATAKVGNEENTVACYIRKKSPNEPEPVTIKGFQTLGGGGNTTTAGLVTGALTMGILPTATAPTEFSLSNDSELKTDINFINGDFKVKAQVKIYATKPGTGTVVMGDLTPESGKGIDVISDYAYATRDNVSESWNYLDLTQKDIPYLYVDGTLSIPNHMDITSTGINTSTELRNGAPFNIFCGSLKQTGNEIKVAADIYIMGQKGAGSAGSTSSFGTSAGSSNLSSWSSSFVNKTDQQFYSEGGSIYSKENLNLGQCKINGDVRVDGNLNITGNCTIYGDLVVNGEININGNPATAEQLANIVKGDVYNNKLAGAGATAAGGLKEGIYRIENTYVSGTYLRPDCIRVQNKEYPNASVENIAYKNLVVPNIAYDSKVSKIETTYNTPYSESELAATSPLNKIVLLSDNPNATWEHFTDAAGNSYADAEIYKEDGSTLKDSELQTSYTAEYNYKGARIFYEAGGQYYTSEPYVDAAGTVTFLPSSSIIYLEDGSSYDYVPENVTIYKADKDGNATTEVADTLSTIYKMDVNGEPTDEETTSAFVYYKADKDGNALFPAEEAEGAVSYYAPDAFGNPTDEPASAESTMYMVDPNGNPIAKLDGDGNPAKDEKGNIIYETTTENYTYYLAHDLETGETWVEIPESEALLVAEKPYLHWGTGAECAEAFCYFDADPAGHDNDAAWVGEHEVAEANAYDSIAIYRINQYKDKKIYPDTMTREAINGTDPKYKEEYKIIKTLADVRKSIDCNPPLDAQGNIIPDAQWQMNTNTYLTDVPAGTLFSKYTESKPLVLTNGSNETVDGNAYVTTNGAAQNAQLTINSNGGEVWIVLDKCMFEDHENNKIICSGSGTVNFLIKDYLYAKKLGIYTSNIWSQVKKGGNVVIRETDELNVNYYGTVGSKIGLSNNCVMCGIAKCPYTTFGVAETAGKPLAGGKWIYVSADGVVTQFDQVAWVGNALFDTKCYSDGNSVDTTKAGGNNFTILYTGSASSGGSINSEALKECWKIMYYDVY